MWLLSLFLPIVACLPSRDPDALHEAARDLLSASMNSSVEPCDDFYEFACGGWIEQHEIPASGTASTFSEVEVVVNRQLSDLLSDKEPHASKATELVKHLYQSCMDVEAVEANKGKAMVQLVNRTDPHLDLVHLLATAHKRFNKDRLPFAPLFFFHFGEAETITEQPPVDFEIHSPLSKLSETLPTLRNDLFEILSAYTDDLGEKVASENIWRDVDDVMKMDTRLGQLHYPAQSMNKSEIERIFNNFGWYRYLDLVVGPEQRRFYEKEIVAKQLQLVTEVLNATTPRVIKNYFVVFYAILYSLQLDHRYSVLYNTLFGRLLTTRGDRCLSLTRELTGAQALSALYVSKHVDPTAKAAVEEMASEIRQAFIELLNENEWMDADAREKTIKKAKDMIFHIGYDDSLLSNTTLEAYYNEVNVSMDDSFAEQVDSWLTWASYRKFREELTPVNRSEFGLRLVFPMDARANHQINTINVAAALFQQPFYSKNMPAASNYGGLGTTIGHEMAHGFAAAGYKADISMGINNRTWSNDTKKEFLKVRQCLVDQYDGVEVPGFGKSIRGNATSEENMADLGGVKAAFRAYQRHMEKQGSGSKVLGNAGTSYSDQQLFFLGYASARCSKDSPANLKMLLAMDPHAPFRYRVNVALSDEKAFADAFQCAPGTAMNPKKQCKIW